MDGKGLPRHVAIIMDGNGRWAKQHAVSIALGHRQGVETLRDIIRTSSDIGISVLSIYAFSTENWKRSKAEVNALMQLIEEFFTSEIDELDQNRVRIRILGEKQALPEAVLTSLLKAEKRTAENEGLQLNIAINYGARDELLRAVRQISQDAVDGKIDPGHITCDTVEQHLYTRGQPDVDLVIRTSGERRLSNFLLYQCAYAEMLFVDCLWPDFTVLEYQAALQEFSARERRFGGRKV